MAEVFLCRKGALTDKSKHDLRAAGVVVVEADDPAECQFIRATETVSGGAMLQAAFDAMTRTYTGDNYGIAQAVRSRFTLTLAELMKAAAS